MRTDSFSQWTALTTNTNQFLFGEFFLNNDTGFVFGDGTLLKTIDGGTSWTTPQTTLISQFTSMTFANDSIGFLVGDAGTILKTINGGNDWFSQIAQPQLFYSVDFADSLNGIIVGDESSIRITSDGGQNWSQVTAPYLFGDSLFYYELRTVQFINDSIAYAGGGPYLGSTGIVIKTVDRGNTWNIVFQSNDFPVFLQMEFINDTLGYACGSCHVNNPNCFRSRILKTIDSGLNWTELYFDWTDELRSIDVVGNNIYSVGYYSGGSSVVVHSTDLGLNWYYQNTPSISYPYQVFFIDSLTGYIVGDNGVVLKTINGGVGISELIQVSNEFKIYPLPTTGKLTIELTMENKDKVNAEIRNIINQKVFSFTMEDSNREEVTKKEIDISNQPNGIYFVYLNVNGRIFTKKFILNKN